MHRLRAAEGGRTIAFEVIIIIIIIETHLSPDARPQFKLGAQGATRPQEHTSVREMTVVQLETIKVSGTNVAEESVPLSALVTLGDQ